MMVKNCLRCNCEFETNRSNQKYCSGTCRKFSKYKDDPIFGGGVKRKGNKVVITGAINCMLYMNGMLDV